MIRHLIGDARLLDGYMQSQREIILSYKSEGVYASCRTESGGHFFVSATPIDSAAQRR